MGRWWNLKTLRESHQGDIIALGKISVGCEKGSYEPL